MPASVPAQHDAANGTLEQRNVALVRLTGHEFSREGPVELAASTAAGPRPSLLFTTASAARVRPTSPIARGGLRQLQLEVRRPSCSTHGDV